MLWVFHVLRYNIWTVSWVSNSWWLHIYFVSWCLCAAEHVWAVAM